MRCSYYSFALLHLCGTLRSIDGEVLHVQVHRQGGEAHLENFAEEEKGDVEPEVADEPESVPPFDIENLE